MSKMQAGSDPGDHTVAEVQEYLKTADGAEKDRVLTAEAGGQNRATLTGGGAQAEKEPEPAKHAGPAEAKPKWYVETNGEPPAATAGQYDVVEKDGTVRGSAAEDPAEA